DVGHGLQQDTEAEDEEKEDEVLYICYIIYVYACAHLIFIWIQWFNLGCITSGICHLSLLEILAHLAYLGKIKELWYSV
ncbi:hypothetical protein ACJX0J_026451, partial [Zea mays]